VKGRNNNTEEEKERCFLEQTGKKKAGEKGETKVTKVALSCKGGKQKEECLSRV